MRNVTWMAATAVLVGVAAVASAQEKKGALVSIDGLSSRAPAEWKEVETSKPFRFKEFVVPGEGGDKANAELIIFFLGAGSGGGVEENLKRWKAMFEGADGKKIDDVAKVETSKVGDVKVTTLDVAGTYLYKPSPMAPKAEPRPNHRMIAVAFESPKGPYFFRIVGPEKTVTASKAKFDEWVKNFK